jgi:ribosomal protein L12E/L44/L45/RPP1/RPP2
MTMIWSRMSPLRACAVLVAALVAVAAGTLPVQAAGPTFPAASRIGLVPPAGMTLSPTFQGFQDVADNAAILLATFPGDAFSALDKSMVPEALTKRGIDKREPFQAETGKGFLLTGKQTVGPTSFREWMLIAPASDVTALVTVRVPDQDAKYTDQVVRAALATLAVRASIPDTERLSLVPFTVGNLAGFRIEDVLPGRALMLVHLAASGQQPDKAAAAQQPDKAAADDNKNDNKDIEGRPIDARLLIAAVPGGPADAKDDDEFARVTFNQIGGVRDVRVQDAEPLRIGGQSGYETLAKAKDPQGETDLMVVQWLRFGSGGYMQMIGTARADVWSDVFTRMRTVRDSIDSK